MANERSLNFVPDGMDGWMDGWMLLCYLVNGVDCFENAALGPLEVAHFDGIVGAVGLEIVHVRRGRVSGSGRHRETIHVAQRTFPADGVVTGRTVGKNQPTKRNKKQKDVKKLRQHLSHDTKSSFALSKVVGNVVVWKRNTHTGLKKQLKVPCFAFVKKISFSCFLAGVLLLSFLWLYVEPDGPAVIMTDGSIRGHIFLFLVWFSHSHLIHTILFFYFYLTPPLIVTNQRKQGALQSSNRF